MILVAGGTGKLGRVLVPMLAARGLSVRVLTRDLGHGNDLISDNVELAVGDVRDEVALDRAMVGVQTVVSAVQGFTGVGGESPRTIDWLGNRALIKAAEKSAVDHFILVSVQGASAVHPMELFRMKYKAEQDLRTSSLSWTIIRATSFMEIWTSMIGTPLLETGKTRIFGKGDNPINFVSSHDVARFIELAATDPALRGEIVEVGGPENLTLYQVAQVFETVLGKTGKKTRIPRSVMRAMATLLRPLKPAMARQIQAGVVMDTAPMSFDSAATRAKFPTMQQTTLAEVIRRDFNVSSTGVEI